MKAVKKARRAPAKRKSTKKKGPSAQTFAGIIRAQTAEIERLLREMEQSEEMEVSELLRLQFMANLLSQLTETATNVLSAMLQSIEAAIRNLK